MAERLGYRPGLDGLRGAAALAVVGGHVGVAPPGAAGIGVAVFFTLSGFLITKLLLEEQDRRDGTVSLGAFYLRRARRLLPALVPSLLLMGLVDLLRGMPPGGHLLSAVTYTSNYYQLETGTGPGSSFSHMWSLAVEEHFYLAWPLVVVVVARPHLLRVCLVVAGVVAAARIGFAPSGAWAYRASHFRIDGMLLGCALAVVWHSRPLVIGRSVRWAAVVALAALSLLGHGREVMDGLASLPILGVAVVMVGSCVAAQPPGWLIHVGKLSYGLYLLHFPLARLAWDAALPAPVALVLVGGGGLLLAEVSWRLVERPWLSRPAAVQSPAVMPAALRGSWPRTRGHG